MRVGLMYGWGINTLVPKPKGQDKNFLGDEVAGNAIRSELLKYNDVEYCEAFCSDHGVGVPDDAALDIAVDMNPTCRDRERAKIKLFYFQNGPGEGSDRVFEGIAKYYDGIIIGGLKVWERFGDYVSYSGHKSIYLPVGTNEHLFYPVDPDPDYAFDVAYCGNDIKRHRTMPYLGPAMKYNFGLFGRWSEEHRVTLGPISRGQVNFDQLRRIYSSTKIQINISFQDCLDWGLLTGRIYDVLACNGFLISDEPYGIADEFRSHMVFSSGDKDLADKLEYYLAHDDERHAIASTGRDFILRSHTWKHRTATLHKYLQEFV